MKGVELKRNCLAIGNLPDRIEKAELLTPPPLLPLDFRQGKQVFFSLLFIDRLILMEFFEIVHLYF